MREKLKKVFIGAALVFSAFPAALVLFYAALAGTPVGEWLSDAQRKGCTDFEQLTPADLIVVLGGDSGLRTLSALRVWRAGLAGRIVVSGEDIIVGYLEAGGVPATQIAVDREAKRTIDHPETIKKVVPGLNENTRLIIVSNGLQERRAKFLFERAGYKNVQVFSWERDYEKFRREHPEDFSRGLWNGDRANRIVYAYLAWLKYFIVD